jgi:hypothetical protein
MSDLRVLGTISLSGSWALVESRRKLLQMLAALDPDRTRTIPFISSLSDAIRWYRQWGKKPHMELIFQAAVTGRRSPPRLLFRLRASALDKPLPQHLQRHRFESDKAVFELNDSSHHDHLVCLTCGRVEEFVDEGIEKRQAQIADDRGFLIQAHSLYLYAQCRKRDCEWRGNAEPLSLSLPLEGQPAPQSGPPEK